MLERVDNNRSGEKVYLLASHHYAILHYFKDEKNVILKDKSLWKFLPADTKFFSQDVRDINGIYVEDAGGENPFLQMGFKTFNGKLRQLEDDRIATMLVFEKAGIPVPAWDYAETYDELLRKVENIKWEKIVVKGEKRLPSWGTLSGEKEKVLQALRKVKEFEDKKHFIIQEFVEGNEISCEVYFGRNFIPALTNFTIEKKTLLEGGVRTGGESNLIFTYLDFPILRRIVETTLKLADVVDTTYSLYDINYIVQSEGRMYALEITPRIGYPGTITFAHIVYRDLGYDELIREVVNNNIELQIGGGFGFGIKLSLPPYPFLDFNDIRNLRRFFREEEKGGGGDQRIKKLNDIVNQIPLLDKIVLNIEEYVGDREDIKIAWDGVYLGAENPESESEETKYEIGEVLGVELGIINSFSLDPEKAIDEAYKVAKKIRNEVHFLQYVGLDEGFLNRIKFFLFS